jgi:hypothetical protein
MQKHKIPKSKCDKTLAKLASGDNPAVILKEFGKSKVYYISQEGLPALTDEEISGKNAELIELREAIGEREASLSALKSELRTYESRKTIEELKDTILALEKEEGMLAAKLEERVSGGVVAIKKEDVDKVENEVKKNLQLWRKRKRSFNDIWGELAENMDVNQKTVWDKIGVEMDVAEDEIGRVEDAEKALFNKK